MLLIRRCVPVLLLAVFCLATTTLSSWGTTIRLEAQSKLPNSNRWAVFSDGGWVKVEKGRLGFYSSTGERRQSLNLRGNEFVVAPLGTDVVGVLAYADSQPKTLHPVTFDLYSPAGKRLLRLDKPPFSSAVVSPNANAFVGIEGAKGLPRSVLHFYNAAGKRGESLEVERFQGGVFTPDGSRFFFETATGGLQECAVDGTALRTIGRADQWAVAHDGAVVAAVLENRLLFYRDARLFQTLAWREDQGTIRAITLSPDGRHAAAVSQSHAAVIDVEAASSLWETDAGDALWNFRSVDLLNDAALVAFGLDYDPGPDVPDRHQLSRCLVFDRDASLVHTEEDKLEKWGAMFPMVQFDSGSRRLAFVNRDRFKLLGIDQR